MLRSVNRLSAAARRRLSLATIVVFVALVGLLAPSLYLISTALADEQVSVRLEGTGDARRVVDLPVHGILWEQGLRPGMAVTLLDPSPEAGTSPPMLEFEPPSISVMVAVPETYPASDSPTELFLAVVAILVGVTCLIVARPAGVLFAAAAGIGLLSLRWPFPVGETPLWGAAFLGPSTAVLALPFAAPMPRSFRAAAFFAAAVAFVAALASIRTEAISPDLARLAGGLLLAVSVAIALAGSAAWLRRELGFAWAAAFVDAWVPGARLLRLRSAESERRRLASDIHAELIPGLVGVANMIDAGVLSGPSAADEVRDLARDARELMLSVRPPMLDAEGLTSTVEWLTQRRAAITGTPIDFDGRGDRAPGPVEDGAYRIAELALDNALRHARATRVSVTLRTSTSALSLTVADDGVGFDPADARSGQQVGLRDMRRIAHEIGGDLSFGNRGGTAVHLRWPR